MGMSAYERRDYRDFAPTSTKIDELIKELEGDLDRAMPEQTWRLYPEMVCTAEFIELFYKKTKGCVLGRKFSFEMFHGPADADEQLKRGPGWAFYIRTSQGFIELWISHFISLIHPYHQGTPSYEFWEIRKLP